MPSRAVPGSARAIEPARDPGTSDSSNYGTNCKLHAGDGFRTILFRDGDSVNLQSRRQRPLGRYFPEIIEAAHRLPIKQFVFDGELIIPDQPYDTLQFRLHPAASRVQLLSRQHPAPSGDTARSWLKRLGHGLDGIVAKRLDLP